MNPAQPLGRYAFIDHLRGLAALAVLIFHAFGSVADTPIWAPLEPIRTIAMHGWQGVHVFFVISGYCITEKIHALAHTGYGPAAFLRDRFWRIAPPYWATLVVCVILGLLSTPFNGLPASSALPPSFAAAIADLAFLQLLWDTPSLLLVSWTLAYEAGFYLIAAGFFALKPLLGKHTLILGSTLLAAICLISPPHLIGGLFAHWPEFWLGMFSHFLLAGGRTRIGAAVLAILAATTISHPFGIASSLHGSALGTAAILLFAYRCDRQLADLACLRWLGFVGVWSYSLYLIHVPILSRTINLGSRFISSASGGYALLLVFSLAAALLAAWIFARLVEQPIEFWRRRRRTVLAAQPA